MEHTEFVENFINNKVKAFVDINIGHGFLKTPIAPIEWRITLNILTWTSILALPVAIGLFFFVKWWIPTIIIILTFSTIKAIRQESVKAIINISLKDETFYDHAIFAGVLKLKNIDGTDYIITSSKSIEITNLAVILFEEYVFLKKYYPSWNEEQIAKYILSSRYSEDDKLYHLVQENKEHITDLQSLAFAIINMEFEEGRDETKLPRMYHNVLKKLASLGHKPSKVEISNLDWLIKHVAKKGNDTDEAVRMSINYGFLHKRDDFKYLVESNGI